jgi:hypothetical protein
LYDVGNPEGIIKFLIPFLNEKVLTAMKIDLLLDFNSAKEMTAQESLRRFVIRGQSLSGMLMQQKNELLVPSVARGISICLDYGVLGVNPVLYPDSARKLRESNRSDRIIPEAVVKVMEAGKCWYSLKFNNELEKLVRTEAVQNLVQILNSITAIIAVYPDISYAINWYKLLKAINDNLDSNFQILLSEEDFKKQIEQAAQMKQAALAIEAGKAGSEIQKNSAQAAKSNQEAQNVGR